MTDQPLWTPSPEGRNRTRMATFMRWLAETQSLRLTDYPALYEWSIARPEAFWRAVWDYCGVVASVRGDTVLEHGDRMPGARWFPQARLNYAENLLRYRDHTDALVFWGEDRVRRRLSRAELSGHVSRFAQALRHAGVGKGDRVAGWLPNLPEAMIAMLATASLGAIWSSASPDFGVQGVLDRFGQIQPKVLVCADGYFYDGQRIDSLARVADLAAALPSLAAVVVCPYTRAAFDLTAIPQVVSYAEFLTPYTERDLVFEPLEFNHPLFIDQEAVAVDAIKRLALKLLRSPDAKGGGHRMILVAEQGEVEPLLLLKVFQTAAGVWTDPQFLSVQGGQLSLGIAQATGLSGAAWGAGARIEIDQHLLAAKLGQ